jgi:hypothetical protein
LLQQPGALSNANKSNRTSTIWKTPKSQHQGNTLMKWLGPQHTETKKRQNNNNHQKTVEQGDAAKMQQASDNRGDLVL